MRKPALLLAATILILLLSHIPVSSEDAIDEKLMKKALKIHDKAIVIDTHVDTPLNMMRGLDICVRNEKGELDLPRMKEGGLDAVFLAVFVGNGSDYSNPSKRAFSMLDEIHRQIESCPDIAELAVSTDDIRRIHKTGRRAMLIGMENGGPVEEDLALLRIYYRLGVRYITLTHNENNPICDSSTDEPEWGGLSPFGIEMVAEMNRIGMMIDLSHASDETFLDVIEHSKSPVIASHSGCRALCDIPRDVPDDLLRALAGNGGVIQIVFYSGFLSDEFAKESAAAREKLRPEFEKIRKETAGNREEYWKRARPLWMASMPESPEIDVLIDHIDHVVEVAGIDHVGLGSDYDGAGNWPKGLEDATGYPLVTYHLLKRGYSEKDIKKILGGNLLRVFGEVEVTADRQE